MTNQQPEVVKPLKKTFARLVAVQSIYAEDLLRDIDEGAKFLSEKFLNQYKDQEFLTEIGLGSSPEVDKKLLTKILDYSKDKKEEIDELISEFLTKDKDVSKLNPVIKSILRAAVIELSFFPDIPTKAIINEYVTIARSFFIKEEAGFVNGILDNLSKKIRG